MHARSLCLALALFATAAVPAPIAGAAAPAVASADKAAWPSALDALAAELDRLYVFPDKARSAASELRKSRARILAAHDNKDFARLVRETLNSKLGDVHLAFFHSPEQHASLTSAQVATAEAGSDETNDGFISAETMAGSIGLIRLDQMASPDWRAGGKAVAAMTLLQDSSALIFDLRRNKGGSGQMNQLLSTYFFAEGGDRWLVSNENRSKGTTVQEWTLPFVPGKRRPEVPLYFLVGHDTGSAAEGFAYNLQALGRAKVVGEKTAGGAHSGDLLPMPGGFVAFIPSGRTINPVTKSNWEKRGVVADIEAPEARALSAALLDIWTGRVARLPAGSPEIDRARWMTDYYAAKTAPIPLPANVKELTGTYDEDRIVQVAEALYLQSEVGVMQRLIPLPSGDFANDSADYYGPGSNRIRFVRDNGGRVTGFQKLIRNEPNSVVTFEQTRRD